MSGDAPSNRDDPEFKAEIENLTLQLDDVTAERNYLQKEIQKMKEYVAKMNEKLSDDEVTQIQVCKQKFIISHSVRPNFNRILGSDSSRGGIRNGYAHLALESTKICVLPRSRYCSPKTDFLSTVHPENSSRRRRKSCPT